MRKKTNFYQIWANLDVNFRFFPVKKLQKPLIFADISPKQAPIDDIQQVLALTCAANDFRIQQSIGERWDFDRAAKYFIQLYRNRKFKDSCLDNEHFLYRN